ncbi:caspase-14-like isoform X2 [Dromiciops gliroides]|uniref:caspase-14-like isoform X2 n=1 Tax=Dromiciops gliroides TaxID=33562 RepID=UPI001CC3BB77|nr:caspase-14-like isoform X2 [Dromiciops gliroides]
MERLRAQVGSTLDQLTPNELKEFKFYLRHCEEPRITAQDLDLAGTTPELADLLQKRYVRSETPRVLAQVLKRVRRMDLAAEWDSIERASRMNLKRPYEDDGPELELFEKLRQFRDEINGIPDDISCCLVTLMAHGEEGVIKTKLEERVNLSDIFEMFSNEKCPVLQEKPKIFVIQACRGDKRDGGVVQADDEPMELDSEKKRLPTFSDYFIIYPTQKDHVALRHPKYGSVMIQAIDEVFQQHGMKLHIADFFTQVNNRVVHTDYYMSKNPVKVVLVMESTLTKAVYF